MYILYSLFILCIIHIYIYIVLTEMVGRSIWTAHMSTTSVRAARAAKHFYVMHSIYVYLGPSVNACQTFQSGK